MADKPKALVFTGGHHTSGLAVAKRLKGKIKIIWFGHRHSAWGDRSDSAEYREVTAENLDFIDIQAGKFHRTYHPLKLIRIPWGFIQSLYYLLKISSHFKITGIVSFGGYLAVPVVIMGKFLGIKSLTYEQTMVAGWANRLIGKFCQTIALAWPQSQKFFPSGKSIVVGLPIREEILKTKPYSSKNQIYITGGKQGSHIINQAVFGALPELVKKYRIIHQTGDNSVYSDFEIANKIKLPNYRPIKYADASSQKKYLSTSQVVVSRSGAHITAELLYLQKPSVLIPIPWGSHNEQAVNAAFLVSQNLAIFLPQSDLNSKSLLRSIDEATRLKPKTYQLNYNGLQNLTNLIVDTFDLK